MNAGATDAELFFNPVLPNQVVEYRAEDSGNKLASISGSTSTGSAATVSSSSSRHSKTVLQGSGAGASSIVCTTTTTSSSSASEGTKMIVHRGPGSFVESSAQGDVADASAMEYNSNLFPSAPAESSGQQQHDISRLGGALGDPSNAFGGSSSSSSTTAHLHNFPGSGVVPGDIPQAPPRPIGNAFMTGTDAGLPRVVSSPTTAPQSPNIRTSLTSTPPHYSSDPRSVQHDGQAVELLSRSIASSDAMATVGSSSHIQEQEALLGNHYHLGAGPANGGRGPSTLLEDGVDRHQSYGGESSYYGDSQYPTDMTHSPATGSMKRGILKRNSNEVTPGRHDRRSRNIDFRKEHSIVWRDDDDLTSAHDVDSVLEVETWKDINRRMFHSARWTGDDPTGSGKKCCTIM
ncbi:unnamed protein product [Amoebophrya sp. A25]|nr:unnamed protein product [Amoebophrya sp. A25]|eukprot:GSA25T00013433001.1